MRGAVVVVAVDNTTPYGQERMLMRAPPYGKYIPGIYIYYPGMRVISRKLSVCENRTQAPLPQHKNGGDESLPSPFQQRVILWGSHNTQVNEAFPPNKERFQTFKNRRILFHENVVRIGSRRILEPGPASRLAGYILCLVCSLFEYTHVELAVEKPTPLLFSALVRGTAQKQQFVGLFSPRTGRSSVA